MYANTVVGRTVDVRLDGAELAVDLIVRVDGVGHLGDQLAQRLAVELLAANQAREPRAAPDADSTAFLG